jgi:hypothetical protein
MKLWSRAIMATLLCSLSIYGYARVWKTEEVVSKLKSANNVIVYFYNWGYSKERCPQRMEPIHKELLLELCNGLSNKMNSVENGGYIENFNPRDIKRHHSEYSKYDLILVFYSQNGTDFYDYPICTLDWIRFEIHIYDVNTSTWYYRGFKTSTRKHSFLKREIIGPGVTRNTRIDHFAIDETEEEYISRVAKLVLAQTPFQELEPKK